MSSTSTAAVSAAIAAVRTALARIDRARPGDVVRRGEAETILSKLGDARVALLIVNDRARYVEVNPAATVLTGYTRSELLRMSVWDLTPQPNKSTGMTAWEGFLRAGEQSGRYPIRRKDGTVVRAAYFATAHVLPSLHLAALATAPLVRSRMSRAEGIRSIMPQGNRRRTARRVSASRSRR